MVTSATNIRVSRSGLFDWIIQRASAVLLAGYTLFIIANFVIKPDMDYQTWSALFDSSWMQMFSSITLIALCAHSWIGMWIISTDYMTPLQFGNSATFIRITFQICVILTVAVYLIWGIQIFWSV